MKLQPDQSDAQTISAHGPGWIAVGGEKITHNVVIGAHGQRIPWAASFEALEASHFDMLLDLQVEVVIFGSGPRIRFPRPQWLA
ncbi:MAG TPA: MTH938/NDUFAF3 family protein, partial [Ramlibacter sp.]|nr:MTH938/NDUFAF3 family protein [Ramlibacter sp.]